MVNLPQRLVYNYTKKYHLIDILLQKSNPLAVCSMLLTLLRSLLKCFYMVSPNVMCGST